jgi:hypothetical protein
VSSSRPHAERASVRSKPGGAEAPGALPSAGDPTRVSGTPTSTASFSPAAATWTYTSASRTNRPACPAIGALPPGEPRRAGGPRGSSGSRREAREQLRQRPQRPVAELAVRRWLDEVSERRRLHQGPPGTRARLHDGARSQQVSVRKRHDEEHVHGPGSLDARSALEERQAYPQQTHGRQPRDGPREARPHAARARQGDRPDRAAHTPRSLRSLARTVSARK